MAFSFRPATLDDIPTISALAQKIWHEHYPSIITVEQINYMLNARYSADAITTQMKNGEKFFLAFVEEKPTAYAGFELKGDHYYLHKFYVDVPQHRHGIGTAFFNYLLTQMDNSKNIKLQVNRSNFKAVNFYFKMGFSIESVGDFDIGDDYYMNDFIMTRKAKSDIL